MCAREYWCANTVNNATLEKAIADAKAASQAAIADLNLVCVCACACVRACVVSVRASSV